MEKKKITDSDFAIGKIFDVIKAENRNGVGKRTYVNGRGCDVFVYIISGVCEYTFDNNESFTVRAGDIMYLSKNERYTISVKEAPYRFIFCDFEFCDTSPKQSEVYTPKHESGAEKVFTRLLNLYKQRSRTAFSDSISLVYRIYSMIISCGEDFYVKKSLKAKINQAREYADRHYADFSLSVGRLAEVADMSEVYFRRYFKIEVGTSPAKYIVSKRLNNAIRLMTLYPFLTLEDCAKQSGFNSLQYFSRVFTKELGVSPSKYRAQAQE